MGTGSIVKAADGARWRVRRRWLDRPPPNLRRLWRQNRKEADEVNWLDAAWWIEGDSIVLGIAAVVVLLLVIFVLLPLLGVALELIAILFLLTSGVIGRVVLRRPWIVEAQKLGDPEERVAFAVKGWRDSSQALRELRTAIAATGPPQRLTVGEPLATKRPSASVN
jgi:hypothetical protein